MIENTAVLIPQGFLLMVAGMAGVYLFLVVMMFIMKASALVVPKLAFMLPDPEPAAPKNKVAAGSDDEAVAVAIAVAMKRAGK